MRHLMLVCLLAGCGSAYDPQKAYLGDGPTTVTSEETPAAVAEDKREAALKALSDQVAKLTLQVTQLRILTGDLSRRVQDLEGATHE